MYFALLQRIVLDLLTFPHWAVAYDRLLVWNAHFHLNFTWLIFCFHFIITLASEPPDHWNGLLCAQYACPICSRAERPWSVASGHYWPLFYLSRRINVLCMASEAGSFLIFREYVLSCTVIGFLDIRFLSNSWKSTPVRFVRPYLVALFSTIARLAITFFVKKCSTVCSLAFLHEFAVPSR